METATTTEPTITQIRHLRQNPVRVKRIVTRPKGSWKWQDAYAVSEYALQLSADETRFVWRLVNQGPKLSAPQLGDEFYEIPHGRPSSSDIPEMYR